MTQSENLYRQEVFLHDLRQLKDRHQQRIWAEHQEMQLSFSCNATALTLPPSCSILAVVRCVWDLS